MPTELDTIRDQQQATWDKFSAGWTKWDALVLGWLAPVGEALLESAKLTPTAGVLDVASGTGEPGLSAAARCPEGKVTLTDLSERMLQSAAENARRRRLTNVEVKACDAGALPFAEASFDAVTARFGFMFFPDLLGAARELARVARPGGRVTTAVWGRPDQNPWATLIMSTIAKNVALPPAPPSAPGLFRCAEAGMMTRLFREAGLSDVTEAEVAVPLEVDDAEQYFAFMTEVAAPVVAGMAAADETARAAIKATVLELATARRVGTRLRLDGTAVVVTGTKPAR